MPVAIPSYRDEPTLLQLAAIEERAIRDDTAQCRAGREILAQTGGDAPREDQDEHHNTRDHRRRRAFRLPDHGGEDARPKYSGAPMMSAAIGSAASAKPQPVAFARPPSNRWNSGHI